MLAAFEQHHTGGGAAYVSQAHCPVCADQAASKLEFACSSLFSNRKRGSDQKGQGFPKLAAQSSPEQPCQEAKGQSVSHSKSLAWEGRWGQGAGQDWCGELLPGALNGLPSQQLNDCAVDNSWPEPTGWAEY